MVTRRRRFPFPTLRAIDNDRRPADVETNRRRNDNAEVHRSQATSSRPALASPADVVRRGIRTAGDDHPRHSTRPCRCAPVVRRERISIGDVRDLAAIPLAVGALAWSGITLAPAVGGILMSVSTVVVALNAQLLRHVDLRPETRAFQPRSVAI
jgi:hypothetical protein